MCCAIITKVSRPRSCGRSVETTFRLSKGFAAQNWRRRELVGRMAQTGRLPSRRHIPYAPRKSEGRHQSGPQRASGLDPSRVYRELDQASPHDLLVHGVCRSSRLMGASGAEGLEGELTVIADSS